MKSKILSISLLTALGVAFFVAPLPAQEAPQEQIEEPSLPKYDPLQDPKFFPPEEVERPPPPPQEPTSFWTALFNMFLVLIGLIAFLYGAAYFMRRYRMSQWEGQNKTSDIQVLERRPVAPKLALYIVAVKDKKFLMAETPNGITSLSPYE